MPADRGAAAWTEAGVRKPPRKEPAGMSGGGAASAALWIFVYDGSACWQPTLMSVLADDVAAHDGSVAGR